MDHKDEAERRIIRRRMAVATWLYYNSILAIVLSVFHAAAAFLFMQKPAVTMLPTEWEHIVLYLYLAAGAAFFFSALTVLYSVPGIRRKEQWGWDVAARVSCLMIFIGGGAMVVMPDSPFAQLSLLFSLTVFVPLFWYRNLLDPSRMHKPVWI
jgi:hypothetical protein